MPRDETTIWLDVLQEFVREGPRDNPYVDTESYLQLTILAVLDVFLEKVRDRIIEDLPQQSAIIRVLAEVKRAKVLLEELMSSVEDVAIEKAVDAEWQEFKKGQTDHA